MVGEEFFAKRLGEAFSASIIPYISGKGAVSVDDSDNVQQVSWELNVSVKGEALLVLSGSIILQDNQFFGLKGKSHNGVYEIICDKIFILSYSETINEENILDTICICSPKQLELNQLGWDEKRVSVVKGYIQNLDYKVKKFSAVVDNIEIIFEHRDNYERIRSLKNDCIIDRAIFSSLKVSLNDKISINDVEIIFKKVPWMLSLVQINACFCGILEYSDTKKNKRIVVKNNLLSSPFHRHAIINNTIDLRNFLENCSEKFHKLHKDINMRILISWLLGTYEGKFIENKIAGLILSYEYLLTRYLISCGCSENKVKGMNIQEKLKKLNKDELRFIPTEYLKDKLRDGVRNHLFHQGYLPFMSLPEKSDFFDKYFDLIIHIILKILGYNGNYISPIDQKPHKT